MIKTGMKCNEILTKSKKFLYLLSKKKGSNENIHLFVSLVKNFHWQPLFTHHLIEDVYTDDFNNPLLSTSH